MLKSRFFSFCFVAFVLLATAILPHHVSANNIVWTEHSWVVTFDFNNPSTTSDYDGILSIVLRDHYANGDIVETSHDQDIECSAAGAGTVTLVNGMARFQNGGYLQCDLPNIAQAIRDLVPNAVVSNYQDPFWVQTISTVNTTAGTADNPVLWHPNLTLSLPYNSVGNSVAVTLETNTYTTTTSSFAPASNQNIFINQRNWLEERNQSVCSASFLKNGNTLGMTPYPCPRNDAAMNFSLAATTFYIGYAPDTGETFSGTVNLLKLDPQWGVLD